MIFDVASLQNGDVLVGGGFSTELGNPANFLTRWDGTTWSGMGVIDGDVNAIGLRPDGSLAIIGNFLTVDNEVSAHFAIFGCSGPTCDSIDFNNDTSLFDPQDIDAFLSVYSEGPCVPANATCNDIDFNNDTSLFDPCDIDSFLLMYSEGPCTPCGQ